MPVKDDIGQPSHSTTFGAPTALPRGPHGLSREQVAASQRARLLAAIAELVAERGYAGATITETARRAGVSPNVFYEHFSGKEECFLAAYEVFVAALFERMRAEISQVADWRELINATVNAYLGSLEADPEIARAFSIEIDAAGPEVRRRRREALVAIASALQERHEQIRRGNPSLGPLPDTAYVGIVHGVRELVCDALESSPRRPLTELAPGIARWITATLQGAAVGAD